MAEPLIFELSSPGRTGAHLPALDVPAAPLPEGFVRDGLPLPELSEVDVVRHFTHLSTMNFSVDTVFYPLGSCTMKYNPKINDAVAALPGLARIHPYQDEGTVQGALRLLYELQQHLAEIAGMANTTLQPAAGAHGELTGVLMIRAYHVSRGDSKRKKIIVPDSAHGTNPATAAMVGYSVVAVKADAHGNVDIDALKALLDDTVAGMMITNPSTIGLFDQNIVEVNALVHEAGGLVYGDGANMNALLGICKPGEVGFDILHFNLHKTFSVPHGGGGPGACGTTVVEKLEPFLPVPLVTKVGDRYTLDENRPLSIGRVRAFFGNFANLMRGYAYIRSHGAEGLRAVSENAVLNANYILAKLKHAYDLPYDRTCYHEVVFSGRRQAKGGVRTLDMAKRLIDFGIHPPTVYFPLVVEEALMIEPTETESRETLDRFCDVMLQIAEEAKSDPELFHAAPHHTPVSRLDETTAARKPDLRWMPS
jgi:glycine cleavage system P protein (glycine dehydrogenase) subunit 2